MRCRLETDIAALTERLEQLVAVSRTTRKEVRGVGVVVAARFQGELGSVPRVPSAAARLRPQTCVHPGRRQRQGLRFHTLGGTKSGAGRALRRRPSGGLLRQSARAHEPTALLLEANELALLHLLHEQPAVREHLPRIARQNASSSGTNLDGYFSEGHGVSTFVREGDSVYHCFSSYARGTEFLMGY